MCHWWHHHQHPFDIERDFALVPGVEYSDLVTDTHGSLSLCFKTKTFFCNLNGITPSYCWSR